MHYRPALYPNCVPGKRDVVTRVVTRTSLGVIAIVGVWVLIPPGLDRRPAVGLDFRIYRDATRDEHTRHNGPLFGACQPDECAARDQQRIEVARPRGDRERRNEDQHERQCRRPTAHDEPQAKQ